MSSDERPSTVGDNRSPEEQGEKGGRYDDSLDQEQNPELLDAHASQDGLEDPVDEEGQQTCRGDTSIGWQVVWKVGEAWPDGSDTVAQKVTSLDAEDCCPHSGDKGSKTDGWIRAVHTKD